MSILIKPAALAVVLFAPAAFATKSAPDPIPAAVPATQSLPPTGEIPIAQSDSSASFTLASWRALRQGGSLPFSSYAAFLTQHRGWPGEAALRRAAEASNDIHSSAPSQVAAYFALHPPMTANGHAAQSFALLGLGRADEARQAARRAWRAGAASSIVEGRLLSSFGAALVEADHDERVATLLAAGDGAAARRNLPLASAARRPLFEAQLALQANAPDAASRLAALGDAAATDAGLVLDHSNWLRRAGQVAAARAHLAQPRSLTGSPARPDKWLEALLAAARGAAADRNWQTAFQIAAQADASYPTGTRVVDRPAGERDDYTSLTWLAATTALEQLGRPSDAASFFAKYARGGRSAQVLTKGFYWAGRAAEAAGQAEQAQTYFAEASAYPELFYGQLSLERLGRPVPAPVDLKEVPVTDADRAQFQRRSLIQAIRLLGRTGQWEEQSTFIRALAEAADNDRDRALAAELSQQISRPDLAVWIARSARNAGSPFYVRAAFPEVAIPPQQSHYWSLAHGIIRQESSFDPSAISHAGARGMMQLMPGTGREVASKLGLPYVEARLTRDPAYNIALGSHYFQSLMHYWGNNAALAAASYNAGSGNVLKWVRENGDPRLPGADIVGWVEKIPYSETRGYVQRVLENAVVYDAMKAPQSGPQARAPLSRYLGKTSRPG